MKVITKIFILIHSAVTVCKAQPAPNPHHFNLSVAAGPHYFMNVEDYNLIEDWFRFNIGINTSIGYRLRFAERSFLNFKLDYRTVFGNALQQNDSSLISTTMALSGGIPKRLYEVTYGLTTQYEFYGTKHPGSFVSIAVTWPLLGHARVNYYPNPNNISSVVFPYRSFSPINGDIGVSIGGSFYISQHINVLWDIIGYTDLTDEKEMKVNYVDDISTNWNNEFILEEHGDFFTRLGLTYFFL